MFKTNLFLNQGHIYKVLRKVARQGMIIILGWQKYTKKKNSTQTDLNELHLVITL